MAFDNSTKEKIAIEVIKTLVSRFSTFPDDDLNNRNAPFHEAFLRAFAEKLEGRVTDVPTLISLSSWMHGLNTTLGQVFFESVSHILCCGEKKEYKNLMVSQQQQTAVSDIITELKNGLQMPNLQREHALIFGNNVSQNKPVSNFTADCYFENDAQIVAIELKTVKPNSGVFKNEKEKMLLAKAGLKNRFPNKEIFFYLGFPFDPQSDTPTGYDKAAFMNYAIDLKKFIARDEFLIADELWNFLSGDTNTMQQILDIINDIATTEFMKKFEFINDTQNRTANWSAYYQQLQNWKMFSELNWLDDVKNELNKSRNLTRALNQSLFTLTTAKDDKISAKYNSNRFNFR
jgi:hypothetical protein